MMNTPKIAFGIGEKGIRYTVTHTLKGVFTPDSARFDYILRELKTAPLNSPLWGELRADRSVDVPVCVTDRGIAILHPASRGFWSWDQIQYGLENDLNINFSTVHNQDLVLSSKNILAIKPEASK